MQIVVDTGGQGRPLCLGRAQLACWQQLTRRNYRTSRGKYPGRTRTIPSASCTQPGICRHTDGREAAMNSVTAIDAMLPQDAPRPGVSRSTSTT